MIVQPTFFDDLDGGLAQVWHLLEEAVRDRHAPFHTPSVTTLGPDGRPRARIVVLREAHQEQRFLRFHTDKRSNKWAELQTDPRMAFLAYDAPRKVQLRAEGYASLHHDDAIADAAWQAAQRMSRLCYGIQPGSGAPIPQGNAFSMPQRDDEEAVQRGRENFSVIRFHLETLEWLYLAMSGHRRAHYNWADDALKVSWLAP
jgi:pyridoxamine 5'-phosphate oxidase